MYMQIKFEAKNQNPTERTRMANKWIRDIRREMELNWETSEIVEYRE